MEGGNSNGPPQDHSNRPDQQGEEVRENEDSAQLDSAEVPDEHNEAAESSNFLSNSDLNRLLQEGECEFEVPESRVPDGDQVDLVIDGDLYRELLALLGTGGFRKTFSSGQVCRFCIITHGKLPKFHFESDHDPRCCA